MGVLDGRVAIITGAGRGLGRGYALEFARQGAAVVVNDRGGATDGSGVDGSPATEVVREIEALGGAAVADHGDVTNETDVEALVALAVAEYGRVDVLVNNAGILRDRMLVSMSAEEWDMVVAVHLRGHFLTSRAAANHWRRRSKAGEQVMASIVNTSSTSGLIGSVGQTNYSAAKAGIAALSAVSQLELDRYGVRVNTVCPAARTRLTLQTPGLDEALASPVDGFDVYDPENVAPFVAYLSTAHCPIKGKTFFVYGSEIHLFQPWTLVDSISNDGRWSIEALSEKAARFASIEFDRDLPV